MSTLTIAEFATSTRTDVTWQASVIELRAITMRGEFTPNSRYDNSINKPTENV